MPHVELCANASQGGLQVGDDERGGVALALECIRVDRHEQLPPLLLLLPVKVGDGGHLLAEGSEFGEARVDERDPASGLEVDVHGHGVRQASERVKDDIDGSDVGPVTHDRSGFSTRVDVLPLGHAGWGGVLNRIHSLRTRTLEYEIGATSAAGAA